MLTSHAVMVIFKPAQHAKNTCNDVADATGVCVSCPSDLMTTEGREANTILKTLGIPIDFTLKVGMALRTVASLDRLDFSSGIQAKPLS